MLSQIGYLGSIITPSEGQLRLMQETLDRYCLGTMNTAKKKRYIPVTEGGLGLINVKDYIISLQCAWVKRVTQHWGDMWRYDLKKKCYGNPLIADSGTFDPIRNPILHNICSSFGKFRDAFVKKDDNYKKALLLKNPFFRRGRGDDRILCERFFGQGNNFERMKKIAKLKYEDFFTRGVSKTLDELNTEFELEFTLVDYMRIHAALHFSVNRAGNEGEPMAPQSLEFFLKSFEKGSKPFRRILQDADLKRLDINSLNTVGTFVGISETAKPTEPFLKNCWGEWNRFYYNNKCRDFLYKFRNNILGLNLRVCNFVPEINAECSLCVIHKEPTPIQAESFLHLFYNCVYSGKYRSKVEAELFPELNQSGIPDKKQFWFYGKLPQMNKPNIFISCIVNTVNYMIWELKLRKETTTVGTFFIDLIAQVNRSLQLSEMLRDAKHAEPFFACRHTYDPP
jgi:hypothetical protein